MDIKFIKIPGTESTLFETRLHGKHGKLDEVGSLFYSVGHSWNYQTQIKGWLDWDYPNQKQGEYRDVHIYTLNDTDIITTIIRNPFEILFQYFKDDWAWCKRYSKLTDTKNYLQDDFQKFVDNYIDNSLPFHSPALRRSLYSQLKDINGKWLLNERSIVLRHETLSDDLKKFQNITNINTEGTYSENEFTSEYILSQYTTEQIKKLTHIWSDDMKYFGYTIDTTKIVESVNPDKIKKNPKIAICFSGHIRDLDRTKDYWTKLIKQYDIDVYASFWDTKNEELGDTIDNFHRIYDVKKVEVESYSAFESSTLSILRLGINPPSFLLSHLKESCQDFGTMPMWYKIWRANLLTRAYNTEYDIVIRARTDTYLDDKMDIIQNNMLNVPYGRVRTVRWSDSDGISDLFAYGTPKIMDYYSACYFFMMEHMSKGHYMVPHEHFLHTHLNKISIPIRFMGSNIIITRTSKGTTDEVYCKGDNVHEHILQSDFMDLNPNTEVSWRTPLKHNFNI
jgi:hypothetical protein